MMYRISNYFRVRRLTRLADGEISSVALSPREEAYVREQQWLRFSVRQAFENDAFPDPPPEEAFVRAWRQHSQDCSRPQKASSTIRYLWAAVSLATAGLLVLFALIYLFASAGQPVTAGLVAPSHPEMERNHSGVDLPSPRGGTLSQPDAAGPNRDL